MFLDSLYQSFAIKNQLSINQGKGGFPFIEIDNEYASAVISIYGAQVLSYKKKTQGFDEPDSKRSSKKNAQVNTEDKDLLFVSEKAYFEHGKAIKGGIPICWPWFGKDQENPDRQMHGFVRNMLWQLDQTSVLKTGETQVVLSLKDSDETREHWPHEFKLTLIITIGKTLDLSLKTVNTGKTCFKITQALHTYFSINDINKTLVEGLNKVFYLDKAKDAPASKLQQVDEIKVAQEVDRIYIDAPSELILADIKSERKITINSKGSKTAVVWNPWKEISKQSVDLTDDAYLRFICIETANAADDFIVVEAGESYTIGAEYAVSIQRRK